MDSTIRIKTQNHDCEFFVSAQESTKDQHLNGEVLKIVALLYPNVGVPKECMLKCAESISDPSVKMFVENRLTTTM